MYIDDQTYQVKGKTYRRALLRNSYRKNGKIHHDTIANLSMCDEKEIEVMKLALKNKKNITKINVPGEKIHTRQGLIVGAVWVIYQLIKILGIEKALGRSREARLSLWLVISAVIGSVSRLSATRLAQNHAACDIIGMKGFCEDDLYGALDWLDENQSEIENRLFKNRYKKKVPNLFLYDVTSSYFEGSKNELAQYGYNRDGKKGKKQIVIGLLTDDEGFPVSCEVFEGNTKDTQTLKSQIEKVAHRFGIKKVTFVGDRGMIKSAQIDALSSENFHYITALTKPQIEKLVKDGIFQMELFEKDICEVIDGDIRYILRCNPTRVAEIRDTRQSKLKKTIKLCINKTNYLEEHPRAQIEVAKRHVKQLINKLKIDKWIKICVNGRKITIKIDKTALKEIERFDGCYAIKTDLPSYTSKETIHSRYKSLAEVEWAFRTMKTTLLHIRGIFVRKATRTRGHVFTIMLAYMIAYELRRLWRDLEITIEEGIEELSSLCATEVIIGKLSIQTIPIPRENLKVLFEKANITIPEAIPCKNEVVLTRKKLVEERRTPVNLGY